MKTPGALLLAVLCGACTQFQVSEVNPQTGYLSASSQASTVKDKPYDLDSMRGLLLATGGDFVEGQTKNIKYFREVINVDDLQTKIVKAGLQDKVPAITDKIGINKAYTHYRPFLWLHYDTRRDGNKQYVQLVLTDPKDLEDLFIAEKHLDYMWAGVNDQTTWYPLFNALIDYIKRNSKAYDG